jgi:hypothetical protein
MVVYLMATKKKEVAGGKVYKGSKQNGGREIIVEHYKDKNGKWHTTSKNAARAKYEKEHGKLHSKNKAGGYPAFFVVGKSSNQFVILGSSGEPS